MSDWSALGLPCPQVTGYGYDRDVGIVRTPFQSGGPRLAQGWKDKRETFGLNFAVTADQLAVVETFFAEAGYGWFTLPLVSGAACGVSDHEVRAIGPITVAPVGANHWYVSFMAETQIPSEAPDMTAPGHPCVDEPCCEPDDFQCCASLEVVIVIASISSVWSEATGATADITQIGDVSILRWGFPSPDTFLTFNPAYPLPITVSGVAPFSWGEFEVHNGSGLGMDEVSTGKLEITVTGSISIGDEPPTAIEMVCVYDMTYRALLDSPDIVTFENNVEQSTSIDVGTFSLTLMVTGFEIAGDVLDQIVVDERAYATSELIGAIQFT